jgi:hypothetical protein
VQEVSDDAEDDVLIARTYGAIASPTGSHSI